MIDRIVDVPKYIRYDFFMALFGSLIIYFLFTNVIVQQDLKLLILFGLSAIGSLLYGIYEMKNNYYKEKIIEDLKRKQLRRQLLQLDRLN